MVEENKIEEKINPQLEDLGRRVFRHPLADSLEIKRVPKATIEIFKKFANDEFVGDYGLCLKWMVDNLLVEDIRFTEIYKKLDEHEQRFAQLSASPEEPKVQYKTMLSGRKIPIP